LLLTGGGRRRYRSAMRLPTIVFVGMLATAATAAAQPAEPLPSDADSGAVTVEPSRASRLDSLFATLRSTSDSQTAKSTESDIIEIWLESGSDTIDLLMSWAINAMQAKNYPLALDYLDRIVSMQPDYVEGWNKRATVHFLVDDYSKAIADIEKTLAIEPRHFGALSGLGTILREIGDNDRAIVAFHEALSVDPYLDNVKQALEEIEKEEGGKEI
jgi:tetratricopeptide (TPR) repeat protein